MSAQVVNYGVERVEIDVLTTVLTHEASRSYIRRLRRERCEDTVVGKLGSQVDAPPAPTAGLAAIQPFTGDLFAPPLPLRFGTRAMNTFRSAFRTLVHSKRPARLFAFHNSGSMWPSVNAIIPMTMIENQTALTLDVVLGWRIVVVASERRLSRRFHPVH